MVETTEKVRENRCRRHAARLKLSLHKSRAKRWSVDNYGEYQIVDLCFNTILSGEKFDLNLDEVEKILQAYEEKLKKDYQGEPQKESAAWAAKMREVWDKKDYR